MATPVGHATDRTRKYTVTEREVARRKRLNAEIALELSTPLIARDLLTAAERTHIARQPGKGKPYCPPSYKDARGWKLPPGVGSSYRAGQQRPERRRPIVRPRRRLMRAGWPVSNGQIRESLGDAAFSALRAKAGDVRFCGRHAVDMDRDEALAMIAWMEQQVRTWRHAYLIRTDRRYKSSVLGASGKRVTKEIADKPLPSKWLGANERMCAVIGPSRDSREAR